MGKHRHGVTMVQRAATFGLRLVLGVIVAAVILGVLALLGAAALYLLYGQDGR